jgi:hypothetical protein
MTASFNICDASLLPPTGLRVISASRAIRSTKLQSSLFKVFATRFAQLYLHRLASHLIMNGGEGKNAGTMPRIAGISVTNGVSK